MPRSIASSYETDSETEADSDIDIDSSYSDEESTIETNYFQKIKENPKKVLSKMDYENRVGVLNQMRTAVSYFLKNSRSTLLDVLFMFLLVILIVTKLNSYIPRLPIGRLIPDNQIQINLTYKSLIEKTTSLIIVLLILKRICS